MAFDKYLLFLKVDLPLPHPSPDRSTRQFWHCGLTVFGKVQLDASFVSLSKVYLPPPPPPAVVRSVKTVVADT